MSLFVFETLVFFAQILKYLRKCVSKKILPSAKKCKVPSHQVLSVFAILIEANEILRATPPKLRREMGMCGNVAIITYVVQQQY